MLKCYSCTKLISYYYNEKPNCLCIPNSKEIKEMKKEDIENCKFYVKKPNKEVKSN
mgnify:CR=1 FL=1